VPVLLYHRLGPGSLSVAPASFDAQLRRLHELGFEAITLDQFVRFVRGEAVELPERPILVTFDDAHVSAWENADPILARYGWSAVMYVPTRAVGRPGHLTWEELRQMQSSGRWQIDEHAGDGHVLITADAAGRQLPFYAAELWADGEQESFARYRQRVSSDIERGSAALAQNLPGWITRRSFAVPFNNYGQNGSNDPRIAPWLAGYLKSRFAVVFVQRADDSFATPDPGFANRIGVSSNWDADALETHLLSGVRQPRPPDAQRSTLS
jgi:peptidoglycan/xylan/chitin deacetylase (PgdA/CDA1 family)